MNQGHCREAGARNQATKAAGLPQASFHSENGCEHLPSPSHFPNRMDLPCPKGWWGHPVCGPCHCAVSRGFDPDCNKTSGQCQCKVGPRGHLARDTPTPHSAEPGVASAHACRGTCACVHTDTHTHTHACTLSHAHTYTHVCLHAFPHTHTPTYLYLCYPGTFPSHTNTTVHTHLQMSTWTHSHAHTRIQTWL